MNHPTRHVHPSIYMILIAPFGVVSGYLTVAVAWQLSQAGVSVGEIAMVIALSFIPQTWKFLWAPVADMTLTRKRWYVLASVVTALGILAMGLAPATRAGLTLLTVAALGVNLAVTFLAMSVESLLAYGATENEKGRAGGWFQAGNLGGAGLGGGAGLWIAQHLAAPWMAGAILALVCMLCMLALLWVPEPPAAHRDGTLLENLKSVGVDLWSVATRRTGALALLLCFVPVGTGAASGLWSAVADDWKATADTVALVTGVFSGVISAVGCLAGGWICDRMDRKYAYLLFGVLQGLCAVGMAFAPHSERMYIAFTSIYAFSNGLAYAGFSAFVLEAMGLGAAATKYNVYASLSNTPIMYMTSVDGWAHGKFGPSGMLLTEAVCVAIGVVLFSAVAWWAQRRPVSVQRA